MAYGSTPYVHRDGTKKKATTLKVHK